MPGGRALVPGPRGDRPLPTCVLAPPAGLPEAAWGPASLCATCLPHVHPRAHTHTLRPVSGPRQLAPHCASGSESRPGGSGMWGRAPQKVPGLVARWPGGRGSVFLPSLEQPVRTRQRVCPPAVAPQPARAPAQCPDPALVPPEGPRVPGARALRPSFSLSQRPAPREAGGGGTAQGSRAFRHTSTPAARGPVGAA